MLSVVKQPIDVIQTYLGQINARLSPVDRLQLALVNGERAFAVVGPTPGLEELKRLIEEKVQGVKCSMLPVRAPFHTPVLKMTNANVVANLRARGLTGIDIGITQVPFN